MCVVLRMRLTSDVGVHGHHGGVIQSTIGAGRAVTTDTWLVAGQWKDVLEGIGDTGGGSSVSLKCGVSRRAFVAYT